MAYSPTTVCISLDRTMRLIFNHRRYLIQEQHPDPRTHHKPTWRNVQMIYRTKGVYLPEQARCATAAFERRVRDALRTRAALAKETARLTRRIEKSMALGMGYGMGNHDFRINSLTQGDVYAAFAKMNQLKGETER